MTDPGAGARESLTTEPELLRALIDGLPAMLAYWDANQRCRFANLAYEKWFGVKAERMIGRDMRDFLGPLYPLNQPYIKGALRGEEQEFEREIPDPAGGPPRYSQAHYVPDVVDGVVRGFGVLVVDITRRKRAEEALHRMERQLQLTERLAAMATLAAGIAHEINNPLASVVANLEFVIEGADSAKADPHAAKTALAEALEGARRVAKIVQKMKLLARGDTGQHELVDVKQTLEQGLGMASNVIRYRAKLITDVREVGFVDGNASQLVQVFVNLLVNAAEALPEDRAERNEIRVSVQRDGDEIVVLVGDNGAGIPEEIKSRIFEPFFTTKDVGAGMGLGLSVSSGIVAALGGKISVTSTVGRGSVFRVVLPAAPAPIESRAPKQDETKRAVPVVAGARARVLVIDDEPAVARIIQRVLADAHDVTIIGEGRGAIAALCDEGQDFELILCDLMMPEVTGADVYAEVTRRRPELADRFVFMTGGAFTPRGKEFLDSIRAPILDKPFDIEKLRAMVSEHVRAAKTTR